jgi:sialate O-acetylesterase
LYGKYLYQQLKYPIGLIASDWGGTPVEAWSSRDAINACMPPEEENYAIDVNVGNQDTPTYLWNAMIHPLLNLTIYGAIWYQGKHCFMFAPVHV